jgi:AcrR family transcriptional regulator
VAGRAGVRPGVVHYHFASVSDLLTDAALEFSREALAGPAAALNAAPDATAGLDRLVAALEAVSDDDRAALLLTESLLAATRHERLRTRLSELLTGFRAEVAAWLRRHGTQFDADATATVLAAALDGLFLHRTVDLALRSTSVREPLLRLVSPATSDVEAADESGRVWRRHRWPERVVVAGAPRLGDPRRARRVTPAT